MTPSSNESKKTMQPTVKGDTSAATDRSGATTAQTKKEVAGATAPTKAGAASIPVQRGATVRNKTRCSTASNPTKTGGAAAPSNNNATTKCINHTGDEIDWAAIRAKEAHKIPKVKTVQVDGIIALLAFFKRNRDESKPTIYRACPRVNVRQDVPTSK